LLPALLKNVIDLPADWFNFADHIVDRLVAQCRIELDPSVFSAMFDSLSEIIEAALAEWPSLNNIKFVEQICESAYSKLRALQEQQMDESWQSISESSDYTMAIMNTLSMLTNKSNLARRVQFEKPQIWFEFLVRPLSPTLFFFFLRTINIILNPFETIMTHLFLLSNTDNV
jgi:hypothetical protein